MCAERAEIVDDSKRLNACTKEKARLHINDLALEAMTLPEPTAHAVPREQLATFLGAMRLEDKNIIAGDKFSQLRPVNMGPAIGDTGPAAAAVRASPFATGQDLSMIGDLRMFKAEDIKLALEEVDDMPEEVKEIMVVFVTRCKPELAIFNPVTGNYTRSPAPLPPRPLAPRRSR